jgi:hypothetical protein
MKRASYREGVAWIADNDEPLDRDEESIAGYISTILLSVLFNKDPYIVARAVLKHRRCS